MPFTNCWVCQFISNKLLALQFQSFIETKAKTEREKERERERDIGAYAQTRFGKINIIFKT